MENEKARYFKTSKDSRSSVLHINGLVKKMDLFHEDLEQLRNKYGFESEYAYDNLRNSLYAVKFKEEPDLTIWKRAEDTEDGYVPKDTAEEVKNDFESVNNVYNHDFEGVILKECRIYGFGFDKRILDCYIIMIPESSHYYLATDFYEISEEEYHSLLVNAGFKP